MNRALVSIQLLLLHHAHYYTCTNIGKYFKANFILFLSKFWNLFDFIDRTLDCGDKRRKAPNAVERKSAEARVARAGISQYAKTSSGVDAVSDRRGVERRRPSTRDRNDVEL